MQYWIRAQCRAYLKEDVFAGCFMTENDSQAVYKVPRKYTKMSKQLKWFLKDRSDYLLLLESAVHNLIQGIFFVKFSQRSKQMPNGLFPMLAKKATKEITKSKI